MSILINKRRYRWQSVEEKCTLQSSTHNTIPFINKECVVKGHVKRGSIPRALAALFTTAKRWKQLRWFTEGEMDTHTRVHAMYVLCSMYILHI